MEVGVVDDAAILDKNGNTLDIKKFQKGDRLSIQASAIRGSDEYVATRVYNLSRSKTE